MVSVTRRFRTRGVKRRLGPVGRSLLITVLVVNARIGKNLPMKGLIVRSIMGKGSIGRGIAGKGPIMEKCRTNAVMMIG